MSMDREPTLEEAMEELRRSWLVLMDDLIPEMVAIILLIPRFVMWLNGDE